MNALGQKYMVVCNVRDWSQLWAYFLPQLLKRLRNRVISAQEYEVKLDNIARL